jgi:hypothetical protein
MKSILPGKADASNRVGVCSKNTGSDSWQADGTGETVLADYQVLATITFVVPDAAGRVKFF